MHNQPLEQRSECFGTQSKAAVKAMSTFGLQSAIRAKETSRTMMLCNSDTSEKMLIDGLMKLCRQLADTFALRRCSCLIF